MQSGMVLRVVFIDHRVRRASSSPSFANQCTPCNTLPEAHHSFLVSTTRVHNSSRAVKFHLLWRACCVLGRDLLRASAVVRQRCVRARTTQRASDELPPIHLTLLPCGNRLRSMSSASFLLTAARARCPARYRDPRNSGARSLAIFFSVSSLDQAPNAGIHRRDMPCPHLTLRSSCSCSG